MEPFTIGFKIRKIRELKSLTQEHIANSIGISQAAYSKLERGESEISVERIEELAKVFGHKIEELFSFDERVVYNIMHNQTGINNNILNQHIGESEFLKEKINALEKEIDYLKEIINLTRGAFRL